MGSMAATDAVFIQHIARPMPSHRNTGCGPECAGPPVKTGALLIQGEVVMIERTTVGVLAAGIAGGVVYRRIARGAVHRRAGHESQDEADYHAADHRVLILGSGFGGLATALELDRQLDPTSPASVLTVDNDSSLLFSPLLWMVADGRASPTNVVVPVRDFQRGRRFHVTLAEVERIDLEERTVQTSAGTRAYDTLVIALGSVTALPDLPGLREHAHVFRTPAHAIELRNHLIAALEAAHRARDQAERRAWLTFIVGGGGDTGVELAATIHDYLHAGLMAEYPWLTDEPIRVIVAGRADRLVPMSDARTSNAVRHVLEASGIEVLTGTSIESVTEAAVRTSAGEIPARTLFWAAGITAPEIVRALPVEHARNGAVVVDDHLRIADHPEVYVIGDSAWAFDGPDWEPVPPTAQAAEHQGRYVAQAIAARSDGRDVPPFRIAPRGHLALLGNRSAVARVGPATITGLPAWLLWHGYYLYRIPSWRNRARLSADWLMAGITGRQTAQLWLRNEPS